MRMGKGHLQPYKAELPHTVSFHLLPDSFACIDNEPFPPPLVRTPQLFIGDPVDTVPDFHIRRFFIELRSRSSDLEFEHVVRNPGPRMHTICNRGDRDLARRQPRPEIPPHLSRYLSMKPGDSVAISEVLSASIVMQKCSCISSGAPAQRRESPSSRCRTPGYPS